MIKFDLIFKLCQEDGLKNSILTFNRIGDLSSLFKKIQKLGREASSVNGLISQEHPSSRNSRRKKIFAHLFWSGEKCFDSPDLISSCHQELKAQNVWEGRGSCIETEQLRSFHVASKDRHFEVYRDYTDCSGENEISLYKETFKITPGMSFSMIQGNLLVIRSFCKESIMDVPWQLMQILH